MGECWGSMLSLEFVTVTVFTVQKVILRCLEEKNLAFIDIFYADFFVIKLQNLTNWLEYNEANSQGEYNAAPL